MNPLTVPSAYRETISPMCKNVADMLSSEYCQLNILVRHGVNLTELSILVWFYLPKRSTR